MSTVAPTRRGSKPGRKSGSSSNPAAPSSSGSIAAAAAAAAAGTNEGNNNRPAINKDTQAHKKPLPMRSAWNTPLQASVVNDKKSNGPNQKSNAQTSSQGTGGSSNTNHQATTAASGNANVHTLFGKQTSPGTGSANLSSSQFSQQDDPAKHMHDRLLFLLARSIGRPTTVTLTSGQRFKGVLSAASANSDLGVVLRFARKIASVPGMEESDDDSTNKSSTVKTTSTSYTDDIPCLVIQPRDCVDIHIERPNMGLEKAPPGFRTDTDISKRIGSAAGGGERELERWTPGEQEAMLGSLDDTKVEAWDQFAANQTKFGIQSTYDEHFYTTAIDRSHPEYHERERRAERIAAEISASTYSGNLHIAEERGLVIDDSGVDEEDKYSGVDRRTQSTTVTSTSTTTVSTNATHATRTVPANLTAKSTHTSPIAAASSTASKYTPPQRRPQPAMAGGVPVVDPAIISSSLAASPRKKDNIESELVGNFRQFVNSESERVMQKTQYWHTREKNERIHDFKKFSQDYKIKTPVPADLVPILTKNKSKQEEILRKGKAEAVTTGRGTAEPTAATELESAKPEDSTKESAPAATPPAGSAAAATPSPAKPASTTKESKEQFKPSPSKPKFNFKAQNFRPSAAPFTPFTPASPLPPLTAGTPQAAQQHISPSPMHSSVVPPPIPAVSHSPSRSPVYPDFFEGRSIGSKSTIGKFCPFAGKSAIEPAYVTPPTWTAAVEKSYSEVLSSVEDNPSRNLYAQQQHQQSNTPPRMSFGSPMMPGMAPGATSPPPVIPTMVPMYGGAGAAGAVPYAPQYYGRVPQPFPVGYVPMYGSPRMAQQAMVISPQPTNGQYYSPQYEDRQ